MNPVKAGLVVRPQDWPWSSAARFGDMNYDQPDDFDPWANDECAAQLVRFDEVEKIPLDQLSRQIMAETGVPIESIRSAAKLPSAVKARAIFSNAAVALGYSLSETARWLGITVMSVSRYVKPGIVNS
jgi:hypothetical protein